jgi:hypothetical protein
LFDAAIAGRAAVVERQLGVDDIGHEVGAPHGKPADRIGLDVVVRLEEIIRARKSLAEAMRAIEDELRIVEQVHHVRRRRAA